ncbi:MAG: dihydroneopterin aldolase [Planctomycetota bacterium]|jgi:dihydroneopterin aldolase
MIGTIIVEGLDIECIIGIHPAERVNLQHIFIDCEIDHDFAEAAANDDFQQTIDYVAVADLLTNLAVERQYQLIETLAEDGAKKIIDDFGVKRVAIKIMKPAAIPAAKWSAVKIERTS